MFVKVIQGATEIHKEIQSLYECKAAHIRSCDHHEDVETHVTLQMENTIDTVNANHQVIIHVRKENSVIYMMNEKGQTVDRIDFPDVTLPGLSKRQKLKHRESSINR